MHVKFFKNLFLSTWVGLNSYTINDIEAIGLLSGEKLCSAICIVLAFMPIINMLLHIIIYLASVLRVYKLICFLLFFYVFDTFNVLRSLHQYCYDLRFALWRDCATICVIYFCHFNVYMIIIINVKRRQMTRKRFVHTTSARVRNTSWKRGSVRSVNGA